MQAEYLVGREAELDLATEILTQEGAGAVLLIADPGIGKTAMAAELASRLSGEMVVMHVHGSPALSAVPFGVLAPYLLDLPVDQATSPVAILREFWSQFEKRRGSEGNRLLLVVDDAHDLDEGSTQILAELVTAGWAKVGGYEPPEARAPARPAPALVRRLGRTPGAAPLGAGNRHGTGREDAGRNRHGQHRRRPAHGLRGQSAPTPFPGGGCQS
ncbi:ATP-binding protein [Paenarthrobacter ureafaciens]